MLRSVSVHTDDEHRPDADWEICCCPCVGHCLRYYISSETEIWTDGLASSSSQRLCKWDSNIFKSVERPQRGMELNSRTVCVGPGYNENEEFCSREKPYCWFWMLKMLVRRAKSWIWPHCPWEMQTEWDNVFNSLWFFRRWTQSHLVCKEKTSELKSYCKLLFSGDYSDWRNRVTDQLSVGAQLLPE